MHTTTTLIESHDYPELDGFDAGTLNRVLFATASAAKALDSIFATIEDAKTLDTIGRAFHTRFAELASQLAEIDNLLRSRFGLGYSVKHTLEDIVRFDQEYAFETKEQWSDTRNEASIENLFSRARFALDAYASLVRAKSTQESD